MMQPLGFILFMSTLIFGHAKRGTMSCECMLHVSICGLQQPLETKRTLAWKDLDYIYSMPLCLNLDLPGESVVHLPRAWLNALATEWGAES